MHSTLASAPGKVLITGGYLVLEPRFTGLVLSVSARFYSRISSRTAVAAAAQSPCPDWAVGHLASGATKPGAIDIWVHSPQVSASPSRYAYTPADGYLQQMYSTHWHVVSGFLSRRLI